MTPSSNMRKPYTGAARSLVIALDLGTTFSGVSYAILEPGEIPLIHGITRFPGQEHIAGNSKIPTILYYDQDGKMMVAGAEADTTTVQSLAEDENWIKVELFKLRLRPRTMKLDMNGMRLSRLPRGKTAVHVFGDFLAYLFQCTRTFIKDTHANGTALWHAVENDIEFVLTHPNGWEGAQQTKMRRSAVYGGLIPDTDEGRARIRFVTEGEASLHACVLNGLANDVLSAPSKTGFLICDAGGGTLDISSYTVLSQQPMEIGEIAPPDCIFAGSVFVSRRAREFFQEKLKNSKYGTPDAVDHIAKRFDETTKRLFRDKRDPQFVPFGSPLDKDLSVGIRSGQLRLTGAEVADLFEPSVQAAVTAIKSQIDSSAGLIKSVFLVGGYAASAWLFTQLQERLKPFNISVSRPDTQTSKAVADGAIGFYCDHHVSSRMSKFMYGVEYLREYDEKNPEHTNRKHRLCELPSGPKLLLDAFDCILARGVKVKESAVFTRKYSTELTSLSTLSVFEVEIWCYRGGNKVPEWIERGTEHFSTLCLVRADLSPLSGSAETKVGVNGKKYWTIIFSIEIHFGLTEFKARIKWVDNGVTKYGPASIIYNERGHRVEEEEPDSGPEDEILAASTGYGTRSGSRAQSRPSSTASSQRNSIWGLPKVAPSMPDTEVARPDTPRSYKTEDAQRGRTQGKGDTYAGYRENISRSSSKLADTLASVWDMPQSSAPAAVAASLSASAPKDVTPRKSPTISSPLQELLTVNTVFEVQHAPLTGSQSKGPVESAQSYDTTSASSAAQQPTSGDSTRATQQESISTTTQLVTSTEQTAAGTVFPRDSVLAAETVVIADVSQPDLAPSKEAATASASAQQTQAALSDNGTILNGNEPLDHPSSPRLPGSFPSDDKEGNRTPKSSSTEHAVSSPALKPSLACREIDQVSAAQSPGKLATSPKVATPLGLSPKAASTDLKGIRDSVDPAVLAAETGTPQGPAKQDVTTTPPSTGEGAKELEHPLDPVAAVSSSTNEGQKKSREKSDGPTASTDESPVQKKDSPTTSSTDNATKKSESSPEKAAFPEVGEREEESEGEDGGDKKSGKNESKGNKKANRKKRKKSAAKKQDTEKAGSAAGAVEDTSAAPSSEPDGTIMQDGDGKVPSSASTPLGDSTNLGLDATWHVIS